MTNPSKCVGVSTEVEWCMLLPRGLIKSFGRVSGSTPGTSMHMEGALYKELYAGSYFVWPLKRCIWPGSFTLFQFGTPRFGEITPWNLVSYIPWISYIHGISSYMHGISSYMHVISSYMHVISSYMHGISSYMHGISSYILWHIILHTMANRM